MITGCEVKPWFEALAAFHIAHPGIEIELHEGNSDQLVGSVLAGRSYIALVGLAGEPPPGLASEINIAEGLAAIVAPDHPLARQDQEHKTAGGAPRALGVSLSALTAYPLVCLPVGTGIRSVLDQACASAGVVPDVALEASAPGAVADLGSRGLGVAVLSRSMAAGFPDLIAVPITGIEIPALLALVWRPKHTPPPTPCSPTAAAPSLCPKAAQQQNHAAPESRNGRIADLRSSNARAVTDLRIARFPT